MTTRALKTDVWIHSRTLGSFHLTKGTLESDIPQALRDEKAQHLVVDVRHMEDTADVPFAGRSPLRRRMSTRLRAITPFGE
jgi:hypothetical protein